MLNRQQAAFLAGQVGRVLPVLVEKPGREPGQMAGRSPYLDAVHLAAPAEAVGRIVDGADRRGRAARAGRGAGGLRVRKALDLNCDSCS